MPSASSKRRVTGLRLALGLLAACSVQPALAQTERYIAVENRVVEPERPLAVIVPQEELATSLELGRIIPPEGGFIGVLIDQLPEKLAQSAAAKADAFAKPLKEALADFDANPLALAATERMLAETDWFAAPSPQLYSGQSMELTRNDPDNVEGDSTVSLTYSLGANNSVGAFNWQNEWKRLQREFASANSDAAELALITWRYQLSADFTNMQVIADVATRTPGSGSLRYKQQCISVVRLRRPSFVEEENVAIWAANDGALARRALEMAFARAGEALPAVLALDKAGLKDATDKKKRKRATGGNFSGPTLFEDDKGAVFYAKDGDQRLRAFVAVQTLRN